MRYILIAVITAACAGAGCARYEYDVVSPQQAVGHVGTRGDHTFALDPLEYRLRTVDNRLVVRVYNPTNENVTLLGGHSAAVDPEGQSHPLITQTIAPGGSFIKLIIPPPRPRIYGGGPTFGVGVGAGFGHVHHSHDHCHGVAYDPFDDWDWPSDHGPQYLTVYDDNDTVFWDWKGEGEARLSLSYARGGAERDDAARGPTFAHELVIRRVRTK